ncbi:ABC transporter ATP-binding protein, partial [Deinococcus sp.]|uniref:ABC transporter ATP-binding protein n=1 Tax=Deinococcus sp. TaxID=47478 RepID=UPI0039193FEF
VPQERRMFASLTVEENLAVAQRPGPWNLARVFGLFPRLEERRRNLAAKLSGGEQQMVAIARALMTNPRLLLLDEPLEGLAPVIVQEVERCIRAIVVEEGMSVILTEQHVKFALRLTQDVLVLDRGRNVHFGPSSALATDPAAMARLIGLRRSADPSPRAPEAETLA